LDEANDWKKSKYMDIQRGLGTMKMTADTKNATKDYNVNTAFLQTPLNLTESPIFLSIHYVTQSDSTNAEYIIEIRDNNNALLWNSLLKKTDGIIQKELLVLPQDISERQVNLDVKIRTKEKSIDTLTFSNFLLFR
jgi:hypothetical protein